MALHYYTFNISVLVKQWHFVGDSCWHKTKIKKKKKVKMENISPPSVIINFFWPHFICVFDRWCVSYITPSGAAACFSCLDGTGTPRLCCSSCESYCSIIHSYFIVLLVRGCIWLESYKRKQTRCQKCSAVESSDGGTMSGDWMLNRRRVWMEGLTAL